MLFETLRRGPAYLVFPVVALSPVVSVVLSVALPGGGGERPRLGGHRAGPARPALARLPAAAGRRAAGADVSGSVSSVAVLLAWGIQAYVLRFANETMSAESIFFYMAATGVALAPVAYCDDGLLANPSISGRSGPWLAAAIQLLNSIGALTMVYAFRYGKVIIVSPMINALAPVLTILLSLLVYRVMPHRLVVFGMLLAAGAFYLLS